MLVWLRAVRIYAKWSTVRCRGFPFDFNRHDSSIHEGNKPKRGFDLQVRDGDFIEFEFKTRCYSYSLFTHVRCKGRDSTKLEILSLMSFHWFSILFMFASILFVSNLVNQNACKQTKVLANKPKCWQTNQNADKQTKILTNKPKF